MRYSIIYILIIATMSSASAQSLLSRLTSFITNSGEAYPACPDAGPTPDVCVTTKANMYVYDQAYGGRGAVGGNVVFSQNKLEQTLPAGWYEGKQASLDSALFSPGNFDASLTLFGVTGVPLGSSSLSECSYGTVSAPIPLTDKCKVTASNFIYQSPNMYGVRTLNCATPTSTTTMNPSRCWLQTGSGVYLAGQSTLPLCETKVDATGMISQDCMAPKNDPGVADSYYYATAYNGRGAVCASSSGGTANTSSCYVPNDKTYYKVTNACTINAANTVACDVTAGNYPYTEQYGGRSVACDAVSNVSNCWFGSANKSSGIGSSLVAANVKTGKDIFGVVGTFDGNPTEWGTGAPKNNGTIKGTYKDESYCGLDMKWTKASGCVSNTAHRLVPVVATDHDGEASAFYVDRTAWGTSQCGLTGTVDARISNCVTVINAALSGASVAQNMRNTSTWNSDGSMGNSGFGTWKLVTRLNVASVGYVEVWRDENTKLFWSSRVSANVNWCRASGSHNNIKLPDLAENDPSNICNQQANQEQLSSQNIISACFEDTGFSDNHADIPSDGTKAAGKAGLHSSSTQKVYWRLPTIYDYRIAHYNGMKFVLPDMGGANANDEWTATVYSGDRSKAWTFQSASGQKSYKTRSLKLAARCIGRGV